MLVDRKSLAKTSGKPGKTQLINFFLVNKNIFVVDLPGYGYAQVSKSHRKKWEVMIKNYLVKRENLQCIFLLIDSNIPPQNVDLEFVNWLGEMQVPFVLCFTKADKSKSVDLKKNIQNFEKKMMETWEEVPQKFITSFKGKRGRMEVLQFIDGLSQS